jgi:hypothetical protein
MSAQPSNTSTTGHGEEPVACTLDAAGFQTQSDRWTHLLVSAGVERVDTKDGLQLHFRTESGVDQELRELVAVETECCSWASWTVQSEAGRLVLRVRSTGDGVAVIHSMFSTARPAGADRCGDCRS